MPNDGPLKDLKSEGVYGQDERAQFKPRMRKATSLERADLSRLEGYMFFVPFIPLAVCPECPDVVAEYCQAANVSLDVVHWTLDKQLMPSMLKLGIDTGHLFAVVGEHGPRLINFTNGIILQDEGKKLIWRLFVDEQQLIPPYVSLSQPAEKLIKKMIKVNIFACQSYERLYTARTSDNKTYFHVLRSDKHGDPALWQMAKRFWKRGSGKASILEPPQL